MVSRHSPVTTIDTIIPAGGVLPFTDSRSQNKALIRVGDSTPLAATLAAICSLPNLRRTVIIGPAEVHQAAPPLQILLPDSGSGHQNIWHGLEALSDDLPEQILVLTSDLPFITPASLQDFLNGCPQQADACAALIHRAPYEARFPNSPGEWVKLRDGEVSTGGAFLFRTRAVLDKRGELEQVFEARKSLFQMARLLGLVMLLRMITKRLRIGDVEARTSQIFGLHCAAVPCAPELAFDIDTEEDLLYARKIACL